MSLTHPDFEDHGNPYAAPRAEIGPTAPVEYEPELAVLPPTVGAILSRSYELFKKRVGLCMAVAWGVAGLVWVLQIVVTVASGVVAGGDANAERAISGFGGLAVVALQFWLSVGQSMALLKIARDRPAEFGDVFGGSPYLLRAFFASFVFGFAMLAVIFPFIIPVAIFADDASTRGIAIVASAVLGLTAASLLAARFCLFLFAIIDQEAGILDSLSLSSRITKGRVLTLISAWGMTLLINLAGLLACGVGLIFTVPLTMLILPVTYASFAQAAGLKPGGVLANPSTGREVGDIF